MKQRSPRLLGLLFISLCASVGPLSAVTLFDSAVAYWDFEGDTDGINSINLVEVASNTQALTPALSSSFSTASGLNAANSGTQAVAFSGTDVLKSNSASLRIGGAQTFWLRVNLGSIPTGGTVAFMTRSRATNSQRGIALQMTDGHLSAYLSSDGTTYDAQINPSSSSYALQANTWYDISLRFDPSNTLRIDLYDPNTGLLLETLSDTTSIPASMSTSNSIGSGYFQLGSINNGSSGSAYVVPDGTLIESAAVWSSYLSDSQIQGLSAVPETGAITLFLLGSALAVSIRRRR